MSTTLCSIYESDSSDYPRQDANVGRDADNSLIKIGAGRKGFDFTKIANDGTELPATAVQ